ncbi:MAG: VWA domain-containing protein [Lachnospiraceae bacterium]|nr:VWA domain-containing protein [Lachnospiraceae bacterium]
MKRVRMGRKLLALILAVTLGGTSAAYGAEMAETGNEGDGLLTFDTAGTESENDGDFHDAIEDDISKNVEMDAGVLETEDPVEEWTEERKTRELYHDEQEPLSYEEAFADADVIPECQRQGDFRIMASKKKDASMADIVFVIDTTGSMGSYINNVKENLSAFVQQLNKYGVDLRISLIDYKDSTLRTGGEGVKVHKFGKKNSVWTSDVEAVETELGNLTTTGGGDVRETPTNALAETLKPGFDWREDAAKFIFLLSDDGFKSRSDSDYVYDMEEILYDGSFTGLLTRGIPCIVVDRASFEETYRNLWSLTEGVFINIAASDFYQQMLNIADWISTTSVISELWPARYGSLVYSSDEELKFRIITKENIASCDLSEGKFAIYAKKDDGLIFSSTSTTLYEIDEKTLKITIPAEASGMLVDNEDYYVKTKEGFITFVKPEIKLLIDNEYKWPFRTQTVRSDLRPYVTDEEGGGTIQYDYDFRFKDEWFSESARTYNHDLLRWGLSLAMSAFNRSDAEANQYANSPDNIRQYLVDELSFRDFLANHYYYQKPGRDSIGVAAASKTITDGDSTYTLIAVGVRGAGYEREWASNFTVGSGQNHKGFDEASENVLKFLGEYIERYNIEGNIKIVMAGFSRAAATTNLTTAKLIDKKPLQKSQPYGDFSKVSYEPEDIFGFCFETPAGTTVNDTDDSRYAGIYNVINPTDAVPKVAPKKWNFSQYGTKLFIPAPEITPPVVFWGQYHDFKENFDKIVKNTYGYHWATFMYYSRPWWQPIPVWVPASQAVTMDTLVNNLASSVGSSATYTSKFQSDFRELGDAIGGAKWSEKAGNIIDALFKLTTNGFLVFNKDLIQSTIMNKNLIGQAHYPSVCLSWLATLEERNDFLAAGAGTETWENSISSLGAGTEAGQFRVVILNSDVRLDVEVTDVSGNKVAKISGNAVEGGYDPEHDPEPPVVEYTLPCYFDDNGQLLIIVPSQGDYNIKITAMDSGKVDYSVNEYDMTKADYGRGLNYFDTEVFSGDVIEGNLNDLTKGPASYGLSKNGSSLTPTHGTEDQRRLVIKVGIEGNGTVNGDSSALFGETKTLTAEPNSGERFLGWYKNDKQISSEATLRLRITVNEYLEARFTGETPDLSGGHPSDYYEDQYTADASKTLAVGQTLDLSPRLSSVSKKTKTRYKLYPSKIVSVSKKGVVTAKKAGKVVVVRQILQKKTTRVKKGKRYKTKVTKYWEDAESFSLTVVKPVMVKSVRVPDTGDRLNANTLLSSTLKPAGFDTSNKNIATVDSNGNITFLKKGKVKVRAYYLNHKNKKKYFSTAVTIQPPSLTTAKATLKTGKKKTVKLKNGSALFADRIFWYSSDENRLLVSTDEKGNAVLTVPVKSESAVLGAGDGDTVMVTAYLDGKKLGSCRVTIK